MPKTSGFNLKTILKNKLLDEILGAQKKTDPYQVLVLDSHTSKIISSCCTMSDLLEGGFVAIQDIEKNREEIDLAATYFLNVTGIEQDGKTRNDERVLNKLAEDFAYGDGWNAERKEGKKLKKKYLRAYVNVTQSIRKALISNILAKEARFVSSCRALNEVNIDFLSYESKVFLLNQPYVLENLINSDQHDAVSITERIVNQLVSLCIVMNEKPYVRYETPPSSASNFEKMHKFLATSFDDAMRSATEKLPNWKPRENPATLLILNRTTDMAAPLIHHLSYQSVLADIFGMKGDVITVSAENKDSGETEEKTYVMNEDDDVWNQKRHLHIDDAHSQLKDELKQFKKESVPHKFASHLKGPGTEKLDSKTLLKVVKDLPKYREKTKAFNKHIKIIEKAKGIIARSAKVAPVIPLMQSLACGFDSRFNSVKPSSVWNNVKDILKTNEVEFIDKASITLLYTIMRGGNTSSEKATFEDVFNDYGQKGAGFLVALKNMELLGFNTGKPRSSKEFKLEKGHYEMIRTKCAKKDKTFGARYIPKVQYACSLLVDGNLDKKAYPYTKEPPKSAGVSSSRSTAFSVRRQRRNKTGTDDSSKPRLIIFVLGGITASEMGGIYEVGAQYNVDIVIGSTDMVTTEEIVKSLSGGEISRGMQLNSRTLS